MIFACDTPPIAEVRVAGEVRVSGGAHAHRIRLRDRFREAMRELGPPPR